MRMLAQTPTPSMPAMDPNQGPQVLPLRDIRLPTEPGFWPLAPGWWILIVIALILMIWVGIKWHQHRIKKQRWLAINKQLSELEHAYQQNHEKQQLLSGISVMLRRFVKFQLNQVQATTLTGQLWVDCLNQYNSSQPFADYATALTTGVYQVNCDFDAGGLIQTAREFMHEQVMKPAKAETTVNITAHKLEQSHV